MHMKKLLKSTYHSAPANIIHTSLFNSMFIYANEYPYQYKYRVI